MTKYSRRDKVKRIAFTNIAIVAVILILVVGIGFAYPSSEGSTTSTFGTTPVIWLQKVLELVLQPILIAQLIFIITEDMQSSKKD